MTDHDAFIGRIQRAAPDLAIDRIDVNQEGLLNDVAVANGGIVFWFPRTAWGQRSLAAHHILLGSAEPAIAGVIDFGTAGLGDPATEIATLLVHYGERIVDQMTATYPISPELSERARFRAGCLELEWALIGVKENDTSMLVAHIGGARDYAPL